jgi:general secretion pathway protein G
MTPSQSRNLHRCRSAFSLLELVAVVTLLGIVTAVVVLRLNSVDNTTSRDNVVKSNISRLQSVVERYVFEHGQFPGTMNDLVTNGYIPSVPAASHPGKSYSINATGLVIYQ